MWWHRAESNIVHFRSMDDLPAAEETTPVVPDESLDALPAPEEETNALTAFTTQWEQSLAAKVEEERKLDGEVRAEAVKELDEWKKQREIRLTKKKEMNRSTEAVFVEQVRLMDSPNLSLKFRL